MQQALVQRADTATSINPRTGLSYTVDELLQKFDTFGSDLGELAGVVNVLKENQLASLDSPYK